MKNQNMKYIVILVVVILIAGFMIYTSGSRSDTLSQMGLEYYYEKYGDYDSEEVSAAVRNYGCHKEIHIYKNGQIVMRLSYSFGRMYEI